MKKILLLLLGAVLIFFAGFFGAIFWITRFPLPLDMRLASIEAPDQEEAPDVEFAEKIPVFPKLSGLRTASLAVGVGRSVREGDVLATLDAAPLLEELRRLQETERAFEARYREAVLASGQEAESIRSELDTVRQELARLQTQLGYRYVLSPVSGIIAERNAKVGEEAKQDAPMFVIGILPPEGSGDAPSATN